MKKVLTGLVAVLIVSALALTACGSSGNTPEPQPAEKGSSSSTPEVTPAEEGSSAAEAPVLGGWAINDEIVTQVLTEESQKAFDDAITEYVGMNLEPAALLGTQVVAGTNYLYLCEGEQVVQNPVPGWYLVVVYQNLEGKSEITSVEELDITNLKTTEEDLPANVTGGWTLMPPSDAITLPEKAWTAFGKASEGYVGVTLSPLALLATQVVAGTNYMVFCEGTTVTQEPVTSIYVATIYEDLEGNAEITDVQKLDLLAYLQ